MKEVEIDSELYWKLEKIDRLEERISSLEELVSSLIDRINNG